MFLGWQNKQNFLVAASSSEGLLTEPTAVTQPRRRELLLMPHTGHCPELLGRFGRKKSGHSLLRRLLFDDLVGAGEDRGRDRQAEFTRGLQVDHQLERRRLLYRQLG